MRAALAALLATVTSGACKKAAPAEQSEPAPEATRTGERTPAEEKAIADRVEARSREIEKRDKLGTADKLDQLEPLVPKRGALVQECGLAAKGPECVRVIFDADKNVVTYRPWQALGGTTEKTLDLGATRGGELWGRAKRVLEADHLKASDVSDLTLHFAINDGEDRTVAIEVNGPFVDPETRALVDELIALAK